MPADAKLSISFLLNPAPASDASSCCRVEEALQVLARHRQRPCLAISPTQKAAPRPALQPRRLALSSSSSCPSDYDDVCPAPRTAASKPRRKHIRVRKPTPCTVDGCENFAVTRGCCVRHGGGARCEFPGCEKRAKKNKRCFTHGGNSLCQFDGCVSKAKRYGFCWAHGGGIPCSVEGCDKVAQRGLCWAHGGGSRCRVAGCTRRSYQKDDYRCSFHVRSLAACSV